MVITAANVGLENVIQKREERGKQKPTNNPVYRLINK